MTDGFDILNTIKNNKIVIYGAGYVARRFYKALEKHKLNRNVKCFVTTKRENGMINNLPIFVVDELTRIGDVLICIAVHESLKEEVVSLLKGKGIEKYIWIYPFLFEMELGFPILMGVKVPLSRLWDDCKENYRLAVRYLVVQQFFNKNEYGYEIYRHLITLVHNEDTAEHRLESFIKLIEAWSKNGYDERERLSVFQDYTFLDGTHRLAIACYLKQRYMMCNVYVGSREQCDYLNQAVLLSKRWAREVGIDNSTILRLDNANDEIERSIKYC